MPRSRTRPSIVFDVNAPINTNQVTNTVDDVAPTSAVVALPAVTRTESLTRWGGRGSDNAGGSGVAFFDVYVSVDGGPFELWQEGTDQTSAVYAGRIRASVRVLQRGDGLRGEPEAAASGAQASTAIPTIARDGLFDLRGVRSGLRRPAHRRPPHRRGRRHHARPGAGQGDRRQEGRAPLRPCLRAARRGAVARRGRSFRPARPGVRGAFARGTIGEFDVDLVREFFQGLVNHAGDHACISTPCAATTPTIRPRRCSRPSAARCAWPSRPIRAPAAFHRPRAVSDPDHERRRGRRLRHGQPALGGQGHRARRAAARASSSRPIRPRSAAADRVVVPGQGAMPDCMRELAARGLREAVIAAAARQALPRHLHRPADAVRAQRGRRRRRASASCPAGCAAFPPPKPSAKGLKVPHMGWNEVIQAEAHPLWQGIADGARFYFVHSYYVEPAEPVRDRRLDRSTASPLPAPWPALTSSPSSSIRKRAPRRACNSSATSCAGSPDPIQPFRAIR